MGKGQVLEKESTRQRVGVMDYLTTYGWAILVVMIVALVVCQVSWRLGVLGNTELTLEACHEICGAFSLNASSGSRGECVCVSLDCVELGNKTYCKKEFVNVE